jgi:hypothetical protein
VVWAEAENVRVLPSNSEELSEGVKLMRPAKSGGPGLLPPPHAASAKRKMVANNRPRTFERNLPIEPRRSLQTRESESKAQAQQSNDMENL